MGPHGSPPDGSSRTAPHPITISQVVGRRTYGVYPLQGKPLNVRDVPLSRTQEHKELTGLMRALGAFRRPASHAPSTAARGGAPYRRASGP